MLHLFSVVIINMYSYRTQDCPCWAGQRRKNYNSLSVSYEWSCTHITYNWFQRRRGCMEKHSFHHVGPGRPRISQSCMEYLLHQHRSMFAVKFVYFIVCSNLNFFKVCHFSGGFHRQGKIKHYTARTTQDSSPRRTSPMCSFSIGKQARC